MMSGEPKASLLEVCKDKNNMDGQQVKDLAIPSLITRLTVYNTMTILFQEILAQKDKDANTVFFISKSS